MYLAKHTTITLYNISTYILEKNIIPTNLPYNSIETHFYLGFNSNFFLLKYIKKNHIFSISILFFCPNQIKASITYNR